MFKKVVSKIFNNCCNIPKILNITFKRKFTFTLLEKETLKYNFYIGFMQMLHNFNLHIFIAFLILS
jgi:hypothetical protein